MMNRKERYAAILDHFRRQQPVTTTELDFDSAFHLLVAVLLSAQCTDKRINMVTPALFRRFPAPRDMAEAEAEEVFEYVKSVTYPKSKSEHLVAAAQAIVKDFGGEVPSDAKDLQKLPGVGRKTANVIQAVWFGKPTLAVDTHVFRVSRRLGLVPKTADTPLKVERELMRNIPKEDVANAHHWILLHGRYVCTSQKPHCDECPFTAFCPKLLEGSKLER